MPPPALTETKSRFAHIPPSAWVLGIVLGVLLGAPVFYLKYGACDWLKAVHPSFYAHRNIVLVVYLALCAAILVPLGNYSSARYRAKHPEA